MVGLTIALDNHLIHPDVTQYRDIIGTSVDDFSKEHTSLTYFSDVRQIPDVNEAVQALTDKINLVLDRVAPVKIKQALQGKRVTNDIIIHNGDDRLHEPVEVANHLNKFFVKKVTDIIDQKPPDLMKH